VIARVAAALALALAGWLAFRPSPPDLSDALANAREVAATSRRSLDSLQAIVPPVRVVVERQRTTVVVHDTVTLSLVAERDTALTDLADCRQDADSLRVLLGAVHTVAVAATDTVRLAPVMLPRRPSRWRTVGLVLLGVVVGRAL
jgi:hypothetical protein